MHLDKPQADEQFKFQLTGSVQTILALSAWPGPIIRVPLLLSIDHKR